MSNIEVTSKSVCRIILGTMAFGSQVSVNDAKDQLRLFLSRGYKELDTARMYNKGNTENIIGRLLTEKQFRFERDSFLVSSKVNPFKGFNDNLKPSNGSYLFYHLNRLRLIYH